MALSITYSLGILVLTAFLYNAIKSSTLEIVFGFTFNSLKRLSTTLSFIFFCEYIDLKQEILKLKRVRLDNNFYSFF